MDLKTKEILNNPHFVAKVPEPQEREDEQPENGFELQCWKKISQAKSQQLIAYEITDAALKVLNDYEGGKQAALRDATPDQQKAIHGYFSTKADGVKDFLKEMGLYFTNKQNVLIDCLDDLADFQATN